MRPDAIDDNVRFHRPAGRVALAILVVVAIVGAAPAARSTPAGAVVGPRGAAVQPAPASTGPSRLARTLRRRLPEIDLDHVVVRFRALPPDISSRLAHAGARIARSVPGTPWTELATPNGSARQARVELARDPAIAQVAFSYIRHTLTIPNDPQWATTQSSYLAPLRLDRTWDIAKGSDITVAVVDTGVDRTHPDLVGGLVDGHNVVDPSRPPDDDNGHGTMVSGIVAARTNNQRGVVGIAPGAKVMPIKVLDANGSGTDTDIAIGIDWARTHHVNVINLSLGGSFDDPMLAAAVQNAIAANIVVVAAAGNDGAETIGFPASYPGVLAVSATSHTGALTSFSSYGWRIDVAAPGLDITSTAFDGSYATESGTSFSSPIVAGVAALVRAKHPTWTQAQVAAQIRDTARDFGLPGVDPAFGHGIVDPLGAVGGPPAAPHPSARSGADEPNDTPTDASVLAVGAAHSGTIAPETDEDWYRVSFASAGWYSVHVAGGPPSFDHQMDPVVELYKPDLSFTASQALTGGDLAFDISVTGEYFLRVRNLNGSTAPYTISVITTATKPPTFATPIDLDFGFPAGSVGVADVNGDNRKDMLVAFGHSSPLGDTLVVFSQTADRSLALSAALPTDVMAGGGMTTGDLDGDGHADIALPVNNGIDVFTHVGPTSSPVFIPLAGVKQLAIADVDGDSHNDIVAVGTFGARVYWGPGPTYSTFASIPPTSPPPTSVAVGNLTGHSPNGLLDVATSPGVQIYGQTGLRTFDPSGVTYTVPGGADVAVGDVTTDTRDDVVASRPASAVVARLVQNGTGGLVAAADAPVASAPRPVAIADIDNDGANDIVVLHDSAPPGSSASVGWLRQSSPGVFAPEETFPIADFAPGYDAKALAVGDVEGDGRDDLVVATSFGLSLLVQNSGVLPTLAPAWITDAFPQSMATNVVASVHPTITFGRAVTNFDASKVQLRDASGAAVPSTPVYDSATHTITIAPNPALPNGRYAIHVSGLTDGTGATLADAGSTFTVGAAPDETAPQTTLNSPPSGVRSTAQVTLSFTADDPAATFWCSFANEPYHVCGSPQHITASPGTHAFRVFARDAAGNEDATPAAATWTYRPPVHGYWMLGGAGSIYAFGSAPNLGSASTPLAVDFDISPTGYGYWVVDALGRVFPFGDARSHGNAPALAAGDTVTSISRTASGNGYWLFTARGRVYPFGDARFYGDMRNTHLNGPVLDSVRTSSGRGYYMVASDGGVFSFGDARFHGSTGAMRLNAPVRSLVPDPDGAGYWLVAVDGGVFAFDAPFRGSMGGAHLNRPVVGMVAFGNGYLMVGADGGIFDFSSKPFLGSLGAHPPTIPIVSVAAYG